MGRFVAHEKHAGSFRNHDRVAEHHFVTKKGQTTLPKAVRKTLGLQTGDRVRYILTDSHVRILPVRPINRLYGILRYEGSTVTLEEMEQAIADGATER